ncbi:hypothetical protein B0H12DRAFT_1230604 [Mycena haematopus]|nr:hypothetical protein B0H12DRAFT_1230604 [Mycena haematopus]
MSQVPHPTIHSGEELIMDDERTGGRDSRYYCLPPFRGNTERQRQGRGGRFYLVSHGRVVGIFDNWLEAQASVSGFRGNSYRGYDSVEECIDAWQDMCRLGVHPHPVDPAFQRAPTTPVSSPLTTPRSSPLKSPRPPPVPDTPAKGPSTPVRHGGANIKGDPDFKRLWPSSPSSPSSLSSLAHSAAHVLGRSPAPTPPRPATNGPLVNFAIRGHGIVSSSVERTERRYQQLQSQGEEPDLLVTHSLQAATLFALDDDESALWEE